MATAKTGVRRGSRTALVLSGGGARGAYQMGVLQGLLEQGFVSDDISSFEILVGSSAGSINGAMLAAYADQFGRGVRTLGQIWSKLEARHVFRTDIASLGRIGVRWAWDLSFGGATRHVQPKSLLDTAPLRKLLSAKVPFNRIDGNVERRVLRALAVPATDLYTSNGVLFVHAAPDLDLWTRRRWSIERTRIQVDHLMASAAIPIFFPSVSIDGRHFGDGSIRNTAPLSHAINLGADRIVAIAVREPGRPSAPPRRRGLGPPPTIAQIAGVILDAVMLDAIEVDVEHSQRVNTSVIGCPTGDSHVPFRYVDVLWISPSQDFKQLAAELSDHIPAVVRYLLRGLGSDEAVTELASYLLFDAVYCTRLIEAGRNDVAAERDRIAEFFAKAPGAAGAS
ncbi:patatin-like phospholipase family protein [Candidatus Binatia bacterium]|nr:patatin-like phospholipase family protein [Candidatus Binatia bacterium]